MALFSIGHSNLTAEKFIGLLKDHGITLLADVRTSPRSRFCPQFNRANLVATLPQSGIAYAWYEVLGGLGNVSTTEAPEFIAAMDELVAAARDQHIVLMCSEANPAECHRTSKLGAWLASNLAISLSHITANGLLSQAQVVVAGRKASKLDGPKQGKLPF